MTLNFVLKLGLFIWKINVNTQKIDRLVLQTYEMAIVGFSIYNKLGQI